MRRFFPLSAPWLIGGALLAGATGCQQTRPGGYSQAMTNVGNERTKPLNGQQVADIQVALGRSLEKQHQFEQAMAAYQEALKHDANCSDAYLRMAILYDRQGRFKESEEFYRRALANKPGNAEIYCDRGYSYFLQHNWRDAEMNLRQALALQPENARAHNNLGLVLAHTDRAEESLAEFRRAGCNEADAQTNLAFAFTLEERWAEARKRYEFALAQDSSSLRAKKGLEELNSIMAKVGGAGQGPGTAAASATRPPAVDLDHAAEVHSPIIKTSAEK